MILSVTQASLVHQFFFMIIVVAFIGGWCSKPSIYDLTEKELGQWLAEHGKKSTHIRDQIWKSLYRKRIYDFYEADDLSSTVRSWLNEEFSLSSVVEDKVQYAADGTIKCLLKLFDGNLIETVLMENTYGLTICVTTQVGCNIGCSFCASGLLKKKRNLNAGEMVEQLLLMQRKLDIAPGQKKIRNVVLMGIGEPFDNYDHVLRFVRIINHVLGFGIGARHITVSTSGLVPKIKAFAHEDIPANLAISLHAANDVLRTRIMKLNKAMPLEKLMEAVDYYLNITNRRVAFEYILLKDVNDSELCARELASLILERPQHRLIYVNLIPYNPVNELDQYERSTPTTTRHFFLTLNDLGIRAIVRTELGTDIDAACGQLRSKQLNFKNST